jgi:citrate synthase
MSRPTKPIRSDIGWSTADRISIFGKDLPSEILGHLNLGDMGFLEIKGRLPNANESKMFNAMVVCLAEHGITPSAIAARMTYMGAPEAMQAAVAAGLCGLGSVFVGSTETCAKMLVEALPDPKAKVDLQVLAAKTVADFRSAKKIVPGVGHPIHKPVDPRTPRLFELARETGFSGAYVELIQLIASEAEKASGKSLPINATGAIGAICCEMGFDWKICRGLGVMARAVGLVGHLLEESRNPMAGEIWHRVEDEASEHARPK